MSSEAETSSSQSSDGGKKNRNRKEISFKLHGIKRTLDDHLGLGSFHLEMPYDPKTSRFKKDEYPRCFLDLKDTDQIESLKIMKSSSHPNILEVLLINEVKNGSVRVYVEPYVGVLLNFLKEKDLVNERTELIPSAIFMEIVSEAVDGLKYLKENGEYHGNFSWDTTLYSNQNNKIVLKLANLERKRSKSVLECQVDDLKSLGYGLRDISQYVQQEEGLPATACCLIDDLADYLISTTMERLDIVMNGVKDRVFFWDENRRRTFFAAEVVPEVWDSAAFDVRFRNSLSMPAMPWTDQSYHGYLGAMKVYRSENGIQDYEPYELKDFFRCISGMYTHQNELHVKQVIMSVDSSVLVTHPRLCLDLKSAMDEPDQPPMG